MRTKSTAKSAILFALGLALLLVISVMVLTASQVEKGYAAQGDSMGTAQMSIKVTDKDTGDPVEGVVFTISAGDNSWDTGESDENGIATATVNLVEVMLESGGAVGLYDGAGEFKVSAKTIPEPYTAASFKLNMNSDEAKSFAQGNILSDDGDATLRINNEAVFAYFGGNSGGYVEWGQYNTMTTGESTDTIGVMKVPDSGINVHVFIPLTFEVYEEDVEPVEYVGLRLTKVVGANNPGPIRVKGAKFQLRLAYVTDSPVTLADGTVIERTSSIFDSTSTDGFVPIVFETDENGVFETPKIFPKGDITWCLYEVEVPDGLTDPRGSSNYSDYKYSFKFDDANVKEDGYRDYTYTNQRLTGAASVRKFILADGSLDPSSYADEEFTFKVKMWQTVDGEEIPISGTFHYGTTNIQAWQNPDVWRTSDATTYPTVTFDENGEATITVKPGEANMVYIYDVPSTPRARFSVVEEEKSGWTMAHQMPEGGWNFVYGTSFSPVSTFNFAKPQASVDLQATKTLVGADLAEGQFAFELKDADGNVVAQTTNTADGKVVFEGVEVPVDSIEPVALTYETATDEQKEAATMWVYDDYIYTANIPSEAVGRGGEASGVTYGEATDEQKELASYWVVGRVYYRDPAYKTIPDAAIAYLYEGSFAYTISEVVPSEIDPSMTYDAHEETVTVDVSGAAGTKLATTVTYDEDGAAFENEYVGTTAVKIAKTWDDADNQDGMRPDSITVNLLADGEQVDTATVEADENGEWTHTFEDLPKFKDGAEISYTVEEAAVDGYTTTIEEVDASADDATGDTEGDAASDENLDNDKIEEPDAVEPIEFAVTNTHVPETVDIGVTKAWDDADDQDGVRPDSITVNLLADGEQVDTATVKADENGAWAYTFAGLSKYQAGAQGVEIAYTVEEAAVEGYAMAISGSAAEGFTITNTHAAQTVDIGVTKTWDDADDQDGVRPDSITVNLLADGEQVDTATIEADENGAWTHTFEGLPKLKDGNEISYTIEEVNVAGYSSTVSGSAAEGFAIANTHATETVDIDVIKIWDDADDQDGMRPDSITLKLLADGEQVGAATVTPDENGVWSCTFSNLPKYSNGSEIAYTIVEDAVEGYATTVAGPAEAVCVVLNAHAPAVVDVEVSKRWEDANNQDGKRPAKVEVALVADGERTDKTAVLDADTNWSHTFTGLPKYKDGKEIVYTALETSVPDGYAATYDGTLVTNTHEVEKVSIPVAKVWDDSNNADAIRPESVSVQLLADGKVSGSPIELSEANNWAAAFANLDKYASGTEIAYSIAEVDVPEGYTSAISGTAEAGFVVTNTHVVEQAPEPELTQVSATKVWVDQNDADGLRPESVTIALLANGEEVARQAVTAAGGWTTTFANVPKYADDGVTEIAYSVDEVAVPEGYTKTVDGTTITNTHEVARPVPGAATCSIEVLKRLAGTGVYIHEGEFTFELRDSQGALVGTAKAAHGAATGSVKFEALTFDEAGDYTYTVTESLDGTTESDGLHYKAGVLYDTRTITFTVHVEVDAATGNLVATLSSDYTGEGGPTFENTYDEKWVVIDGNEMHYNDSRREESSSGSSSEPSSEPSSEASSADSSTSASSGGSRSTNTTSTVPTTRPASTAASTTTARTGDESPLGVLAVMMLLSGGVLVYVRRRRMGN